MQKTANLTDSAQQDFWAEAVSTSNYYEDLVIKSGRDKPALAVWTQTNVTKWVKKLVEYGRIGVANSRKKFSAKTSAKGVTVMMVGFAMNHGPGCYRVYNPKTNRIIFTRDVNWSDFKPKQLENEFDIFEPGIESVSIVKPLEAAENNDSGALPANGCSMRCGATSASHETGSVPAS